MPRVRARSYARRYAHDAIYARPPIASWILRSRGSHGDARTRADTPQKYRTRSGSADNALDRNYSQVVSNTGDVVKPHTAARGCCRIEFRRPIRNFSANIRLHSPPRLRIHPSARITRGDPLFITRSHRARSLTSSSNGFFQGACFDYAFVHD